MIDHAHNEKINTISSKVIDVLKPYYPSDSFNALSNVLSAILAAYCIDENVDLEPLLKDLFSDIRNITDIHIKAINNRQIKVEI